MKRLFFGLSFAAMALFVACGGDSGSSADSLDESSSSSEMDGTESSDSVNPSSSDQVTLSSDSEDLNPSGSEGGKSSGSVEGTSSDSSEGNSSGSSEEPDSDSSEGDSSSSEGDEIDNGSVYDADANTLTDLRDGHVYRTTTIDIPVKDYSEVWMAENLNYKTANSYCYGDDPDKCNIYGRLYKWSAAVGRSEEECGYYHECNLPVGNIRGACPEGWHLPSEGEFELLVIAVDGSLLLVLLPAGTGEIAAGDAFDGKHRNLLHEHRAPLEIGRERFRRVGVFRWVGRYEMVLDAEEIHPEKRNGVEHLALVRDAARKNHVVGAYAVGDDHDHVIGAEGIYVAYFAGILRYLVGEMEIGADQCFHKVCLNPCTKVRNFLERLKEKCYI